MPPGLLVLDVVVMVNPVVFAAAVPTSKLPPAAVAVRPPSDMVVVDELPLLLPRIRPPPALTVTLPSVCAVVKAPPLLLMLK